MSQRLLNNTKWLCCLLALHAGSFWGQARSVTVRTPPSNPSTIEAQAKFFQDFFSVQLSPYKIEFGHVCEDPNTWEQRYEKKDFKNHRDMGKVRWGDKKGGYGEHYWDLNHAGHAGNDDGYDGDDGSYHESNNNDPYDKHSDHSPNYGTDDYDPENSSYEESGRAKRAHPKINIDRKHQKQTDNYEEESKSKKQKRKNREELEAAATHHDEEYSDDEDDEEEESYEKPKPKRKHHRKQEDKQQYRKQEDKQQYREQEDHQQYRKQEDKQQYREQEDHQQHRNQEDKQQYREQEEDQQQQNQKPKEKNQFVLVVTQKDDAEKQKQQYQPQYVQKQPELPQYLPKQPELPQYHPGVTLPHYVPYEGGAGVRQHQQPEVSPAATVPRLFLEPSTGHVVDRATGQAYVLQPIAAPKNYN